MHLTSDQLDSLQAAAKPLAEWLQANAHPHCEAKVTQTSVELTEMLAHIPDVDAPPPTFTVLCTTRR